MSGNHKTIDPQTEAIFCFEFRWKDTNIWDSFRPDEIFMSLHFANLVHLCNVLQATSKQRTCHSYMGTGLAQWNIKTKHVNCSSEIQCQLVVEPSIDPAGFSVECADHWTTRNIPCWNECRKNVDIGGFPFDEICSFCCEGELCNDPSAFGYSVPEYTDVTDAACGPNGEFTLWFMVTVMVLSFL